MIQHKEISIARWVAERIFNKQYIDPTNTTKENKMLYSVRNTLIAFLAMFCFTLGVAPAANADAIFNKPTPAYVIGTAHADLSDSSVAISSSAASGKILLVDNTVAKASKKSPKKLKCQRFKKFWNSGVNAAGVKYTFLDRNGYLCRDSHSPTGWVKRGGGMTGNDCRNVASPPKTKPKGYKVTVRSKVKLMSKFKWTAKATAKATLSVKGSAEASCVKDGASASSYVSVQGFGSSTASASATASSKASALATAQSNAKNGAMQKAISNQKGEAKAAAIADVDIKIDAYATAYCQGSTPPVYTCPPNYTGEYPNCTPPPVCTTNCSPTPCPTGSTTDSNGNCVKDGSSTPAPPTTAPGPNPGPSDTVSSKCYSETTGLPVAPNADNTCPPGSFGGPTTRSSDGKFAQQVKYQYNTQYLQQV